jgi:hypothetical protein
MTIFTACAVKAKGGKECLIESGEICPEREESYSAGKYQFGFEALSLTGKPVSNERKKHGVYRNLPQIPQI